ncbi:Heparanase [Armadillidium nasatum]|uniref:Heparanase n=1 Tax=Armadillidium nasatum TaxID=96803 RepID=A0A5N5TN54_9CRUS|nr:Heparanase [Armadillidium nasatum]
MDDDLYEVYSPEEETSVLQENYVRDIRKVFKTLTHACNSLPKTLPRIHSRKQRNPQTTAQRLAISLKRWAEKWLNLVEVRLEDFLVACVKDKNCERYFHKVIKMLVDILEEYQFYLDKNTSSLLQEFQQYKNSPSMDTMNYIQRASLMIGDSFAIIEFDEDKIVQKVPKTFLSSAFGTSLIQDGWREAKTQKDKFLKIASALSPALFRVGGSGANFLTYDPLSSFETISINSNSPQVDPLGVQHHKGYSTRKKNNRNRSGRRMARDTPKRLLKGVRNQYMIETNELTMDVDHSFDFKEICEVQNEVGKVFTNFTMTIGQLDWPLIWDLNQFWRDPNGDWDPTNAKLIIDDPYSSDVPIIWQIGNEPNNYNHHFNWSIKPEEAVKDYKCLNEILQPSNSNSNKPLIIGPDVTRPRLNSEEYDENAETATAWGGGAPELSPSFASCFPWLDKLGSAALGGISVVFRQTLYGGCYALIDDQLNPYPNYWVSVLHKKIMGQEVLLPRVRAIVILILNLSNEKEIVQLIGETLKSSPKYLYELSAPNGNLLSRNILLNKKMLNLNDDGSLPDFEPVLVQTEDLLVPPLTITFWVLPEAEYQACSKE